MALLRAAQLQTPRSADGLMVSDICIGDRPLQLEDRALQAQIISALGADPKAVIETASGLCNGANNEGIWTLRTVGEELVLKFVKNQPVFPGVPTDAESLIRISRQYPSIANDSTLAFPRRIIRLLGSRGNLRYDLIVMQKARGEPVGNVIQQKWRRGLHKEVTDILDKVATCLAVFHQQYSGQQHGDLNPSNVLYDAVSGHVTFIDVAGMGNSYSESDVDYLTKGLALSAQLLKIQENGLHQFQQSYKDALQNSAGALAAGLGQQESKGHPTLTKNPSLTRSHRELPLCKPQKAAPGASHRFSAPFMASPQKDAAGASPRLSLRFVASPQRSLTAQRSLAGLKSVPAAAAPSARPMLLGRVAPHGASPVPFFGGPSVKDRAQNCASPVPTVRVLRHA